MKSIRKSSKSTLVVFVLAIAMLLVSAVGGSKAALTYFSDDYKAEIGTQSIGVTLYEKGGENGKSQAVSWRNYTGSDWDEKTGDLISWMDEGKITFGKSYDEALTVKNTGTTNEYVRATVYKYWVDQKGNKDINVSPELIKLNFITNGGWQIDEKASTAERTVLYYDKMLKVNDESNPFTDEFQVYYDKKMVNTVTQETTKADGTKYKKIVTTYDYNGYQFVIEVAVDAIQDHNAANAAKAVWGRDVSVSGGKLTLK